MAPFECEYVGLCNGCSWGAQALSKQHEQKLSQVRAIFPRVEFVFSPSSRVRDKVDLVWEDGRLGLYEIPKNSERPRILDLAHCVMMSEPLEKFFQEFRALKPPIKKGSVRLRVSPQGERGVWLDFANQDVKNLFEQKDYLRQLSDLAFVEIGQRRKALTWKDGQPKLVDPILKPWFETYDGEGQAIPLFGPVGGFSQTGFRANKALISSVTEAVKSSKISGWLELFCGNGNLTVALAARGYQVEAVEMDELALEGLGKTLESRDPHLTIQMSRADVYLKTKSLPPILDRGLLVDPPRAGMREILTLLEQGATPKAIVYVSCFTDVFISDVERLKSLGYQIQSLQGVDQFPHSPHAEWVALLTRS